MNKKSAAAFLFLIIASLSLTVTVQFGLAQTGTNVSGIINSDTTWTKTNSPYSLTGPVAVNNGVTLTIQAGTTVNIDGYYIQVNGTMIAKGNSTDRIQLNGGQIFFTQLSKGWNEQKGSGSIIENSIIDATIDINNASPKINNNSIDDHIDVYVNIGGISPIISNNNVNGVISSLSTPDIYISSPIISNNVVTGSIIATGSAKISNNTIISGLGKTYGIYADAAYIINNVISGFQTGIYADMFSHIEKNLITNNYYGIDLSGVGANTIVNNTIANNSYGILSPKISSTIIYNNIQNKNYNLYLDCNANADVTATYNWWGTTDAQAINQSIHDFKNDFNLGNVTFIPFLTGPNAEGPAIPTANPNPWPTANPTPTQTPNPTPSPSIPEFPPWTILPTLLAATTLLAAALKRRLTRATPEWAGYFLEKKTSDTILSS